MLWTIGEFCVLGSWILSACGVEVLPTNRVIWCSDTILGPGDIGSLFLEDKNLSLATISAMSLAQQVQSRQLPWRISWLNAQRDMGVEAPRAEADRSGHL